MPKPRRPLTAGGYIEAGRVQFDNRRLFDAALKAWNGTRVVVAIAPEVQSRSQRAHNYLFGVVYAEVVRFLADANGQQGARDEKADIEFLHDEMKKLFNFEERVSPATGELVRYGKSTKKLSVEEFGVFIENVMLFFAERYGLTFPEPRKHEEYRERVA